MKQQNRKLSLRMRGKDVQRLQEALGQIGFSIADREGYFGKTTRQAVLTFQEQQDLEPTGVVDEETAGLINREVERQQQPTPSESSVVKGRVVQVDGKPFAGGLVRAYDRDLRSEELLGEAVTDSQGLYEIGYTADQFRRAEKKCADLVVRAYTDEDVLLRESPIIFGASQTETVDLVVQPPPPEREPSEYEQLVAVLAPNLQGLSPAELTEKDIEFLLKQFAEEPAVKARPLRILAQGARLARDMELPAELLYGLAHALDLKVPLSREVVLGLEASDVRQGLTRAIEEGIVPQKLRDSIDIHLARLERLKLEYGFLVRREVVGRLLDEETGKALFGFKVRGYHLHTGEEPKDLGYDITNKQGLFSFVVLSLPEPAAEEPTQPVDKLQLRILNAQGEEIHQAEFELKPGQTEVLDVLVPAQALPQPPSHPLKKLATDLNLSLPRSLLPFLAECKIRTLEDIRRAGGLRRLDNLPVAADHPAVKALEAHANLSVLSDDPNTNDVLINRGYDSLAKIAGAPRSDFLRSLGGELGEPEIRMLHISAKSQADFLNATLAGARAEAMTGGATGLPSGAAERLAEWFELRCHCEDCESAVSPAAYLVDLLRYAEQYLEISGSTLYLADLENQLHQPFGQLRVSCEQVQKEVRQVRICIEVLRGYLDAERLPRSGSSAKQKLSVAERQYREEAYRILLNELGASPDELRKLPSMAPEEREALAERLAIPPENLEALLLDPDTELTEQALERLFGFADTQRDPLAEAPVPELQVWRLEHLHATWLREDWPEEEPAGARPLIDPDLVSPGDLKHPVWGNRAFELWERRSEAVSNLAEEIREAVVDSDVAQAVEIAFTPDVPSSAPPQATLADLRALHAQLEAGEDVEADIAGLGFTPAALRRFISLADQAESGATLLISEREELANILVQSWKVRHYRQWRFQERGMEAVPSPVLTLSPEWFQIAPEEPEILPWRASWEDRRAWQDMLKARIDQEESIIRGLQEAVDHTEQATLTLLRDALVTATEQTAEELTKRLLIDCATSACQKTTRVAQAIETLQNLIFGLQTGLLTEVDVLQSFELTDEHFEERWQWLGSYANWRAALFVFLYPENVLMPTLRRWQTPAFRSLVCELRNNRRLTPEQACEAAARYADYFRDVCDLTLEAAVQAEAPPGGTCRGIEPPVGSGQRVYVFARGTWTNRVYVSHYDSEVDRGIPDSQSPWQPVPGLEDVVGVVGATVYDDSIYLFAIERTNGNQKLVYTTYDIQRGAWTAKVEELGLPEAYEEGSQFTAVIKQTHQRSRPHVAIRLESTGAVYEREFSEEGSSWDDWRMLAPAELGIYKLVAMVERREGEVYVVTTKEGLCYRILGDKDDGLWASTPIRFFTYASTFCLSDYVYLFRDGDSHPYPLICYTLRGASGSNLEEKPELFDFLEWVEDIAGLGTRLYDSLYGKLLRHKLADTDSSLYGAIVDPDGSGVEKEALIEEIDSFVSDLLAEGDQWEFVDQAVELFTSSDFSSLVDVLTAYVNGDTVRIKKRAEDELVSCRHNDFLHQKFFYATGSRGHVVSHLRWRSGTYRSVWTREEYYRFSESPPIRIAPWVDDALDITERLSERECQRRRRDIHHALDRNEDSSSSVFAYLEEAWYAVPIYIASQLQRRRQFAAALNWFRTVYDYTYTVKEERNIYYGLLLGPDTTTSLERAEDWLLDPLNPHAIAASRRTAHTRFTLLAIIRCLLDFADAEFTRDTAESLPRARQLYMLALELLALPELEHLAGQCEQAEEELALGVVDKAWRPAFLALRNEFKNIRYYDRVSDLVWSLNGVIAEDAPMPQRYAQAEALVLDALASQPETPSYATLLEMQPRMLSGAYDALLSDDEIADATRRVGKTGSRLIERGLAEDPYLGRAVYDGIGEVGSFLPTPITAFCVPPNPLVKGYRLHAELNLFKLRTCRNIAGMERPLEPYAAPTDTVSGLPGIANGERITLPAALTQLPTLYRYQYLIERAKQMADRAAQMEAAFLAALEKRDAEYYNLMKARQDLALAHAGVRLQELRVREAEDGIELAELQREVAQMRSDHYKTLLQTPTSQLEQSYLDAMSLAASEYSRITSLEESTEEAKAQARAQAESFQASMKAAQASYERRRQEWQFQEKLALHDIKLSHRQVRLANDRVAIVRHERVMSQMQADNAEAIADFLANKFTNVELYDWMSGILQGVYNFFLQQATAVAQLAEAQLAFERQQTPPAIIQADYWEAPADDAVAGIGEGEAADRRGLTGSARLLADIYRLDQYRFETEQRKLQLSEAISLARLAPAEFQRFRETGVMVFDTPMTLFDRDFPGHYLRLIKRVRTSVIALIPATEGIHATLATTGLSRVVVNRLSRFEEIDVQRLPESVALSSPRDATGLFELAPQSQPEMLLPFEGLGVATSWEFRMPKASNLFDYRTIADVLITIEYTALDSFDYRQQVIRELDDTVGGDRPFSFRHELPDQWYDLHNPDQTATPMIVRFETRRADFPPNIEDLRIQHVVLYFARADGATFEVLVSHLHFTEQGSVGPIGGGATSSEGLISTRSGSAGSWMAMTGKAPIGGWELALPNTAEMRDRFKNGEVENILFVVTYSGRTPQWPT